ncbi:MAG: hypothetical protein KF729_06610 [Sandaracinaceae bacterium]|nr:hypothetical protein [Sandaracinaceae bacterium]
MRPTWMCSTSLGVLALLAACAAPAALEPAPAPLIGAADGGDSADRACAVVLRSVRRAAEADGRPATKCADGRCWILLEATVEVADRALAEGGLPELLYRNPEGADGWFAATLADPAAGAPAGVSRFRIRFGEGGVRDGLTASATTRSRIEVVAYLRGPRGGRLFDHNELPGDFDNQLLSGASHFSFDARADVCPGAVAPSADATIRFGADWRHTLEGTLRAGGTVAIDYDLARLPQCAGDTYMGRRSFDTLAHARVWPSGELLEQQSLLECAEPYCTDPGPRRPVLQIPAGATSIELWFSTSGRSCGVHYDSAFGRNYHFALQRPVGWVGNFVAKVSRAGGAPCEGAEASPLTGPLRYETWARTRSVMGNVCFSVWSEGVTDFDNPALESAVGASVTCTWDGEASPRRHAVTLDGRVGNDARYRLDLRALDPLASYRCPEVPTRVEGGYEVAGASCTAEVNGASWGAFRLDFADYPSPWRDANCAR